MTLQERLLAVFRHERPDVVPWFADLTYWYAAQSYWGTLPERWQGDGVAQMYRDLNVGCHEHALSLPCEISYHDIEVVTTEEKDADGRPYRQQVEWRTPVGTITQIKQFEPLACTWAYRQYPVQTPQDLKVLRFIHESQEVKPFYEAQQRQMDLFGEWGVAASIPPRSPLANLIVIWMGVINTMYALHDAPQEIERTLEVLAAADDPIYEAICGAPAPLVYFGENITGEVVSPKLFEKYYAPYYRQRVPQLHAAGKFIFVHVDGTFRKVLAPLAATGVDCAQSLTPAPVGDVPVAEMRAVAESADLILWGGVPAAFFSPLYPEEALRDIVLECLRCYRDDDRFMLCVCDQVPPDGIIDRVRLVSDLVEEHGRKENPCKSNA